VWINGGDVVIEKSSGGELGDGAAANEQRRRLEWLGMGSDWHGAARQQLSFFFFFYSFPSLLIFDLVWSPLLSPSSSFFYSSLVQITEHGRGEDWILGGVERYQRRRRQLLWWCRCCDGYGKIDAGAWLRWQVEQAATGTDRCSRGDAGGDIVKPGLQLCGLCTVVVGIVV
jgi:hypothetical protein